MRFRCLLALLVTLAAVGPLAGAPVEFNRDIRPILAENCFYCHGQDANKRQAELRLDVRDDAVRAKAIVPGDVAASEFVRRIHTSAADEQMPPPDSNRRLSPEQKKLLEQWIAEGAIYQSHWAFIAPMRPALPEIENGQRARNPLDRFVLAKLDAVGLTPSPPADRATLIKRLSADLTGLPPVPAEVDTFVADASPDAYERLVDRLAD